MTEPTTPGAPTEFDYLLNRFERASQADKPAEHGYKMHRDALCAYVHHLGRMATRSPPQPDRAVMQQALDALGKARFDSLNMSLADMRELRAAAESLRAALSATQEKP